MDGQTLLTSLISANPQHFAQKVRSLWLAENPAHTLLLPPQGHQDLALAVNFLLTASPTTASKVAAQLATEHRRYGLSGTHISSFMAAVKQAIRELAAELPFSTVFAAEQHLDELTQQMVAAITAQEQAHLPAITPATVVATEQRSRYLHVIRLTTTPNFTYAPGQFVPIAHQLSPLAFRLYSPAIPANAAGELEFHIRHLPHGKVSPLLACSRPGDTWLLGQPLGTLHLDPGQDALLIAHTTGLASLRCLILGLPPHQAPRVHLFFCADFPGELYDLTNLWQIAAHLPWLQVTPVARFAHDDFSVGATNFSAPPRGLHLQQIAPPEKLIPSFGTWADRQILLAGPKSFVASMKKALVAAGTPAANLRHDPF